MGGEMKVWTLNGKLIHVGDWDYMYTDELEEVSDDIYHGEKLIKSVARMQPTGKKIARNPTPDGAVETDSDVIFTDLGRAVLPSEYRKLRADAYPSIADQLDALWKGGDDAELMREKVMSIKNRYPKDDPS